VVGVAIGCRYGLGHRRTRQLLLDAAVREFSEHGYTGARMDRIGSASGVNKNDLPVLRQQERLFERVLETELERIATTIPLTVEQAADLGEYAGRLYDYHRRTPTSSACCTGGLQDRGVRH